MNEEIKNWKLKLRYGKLTTIYQHFTSITEGVVAKESDYAVGNAFMALKMWVKDDSEAIDLVSSVAKQVGFVIKDKVELFNTDPIQPPQQEPYGYDLKFTYFKAD
ncbi:hypothetical protein HHL22_15345 [Hymenobacter sp. RP-2-7]|uniref:Uncharacterized protein n=1 Tax=Hymenobacter polaris TaxID=2682546 RepID=A0A7Y0FN61_9BACT|nr:hypothetical protein [Hymenobacter polaris]NML66583.1 hypothetical protein [Hymenobacter polaris]